VYLVGIINNEVICMKGHLKMDILNMIKDSYMNLDLKARSKKEVIEELAKKTR
jgi:hypothetical protein